MWKNVTANGNQTFNTHTGIVASGESNPFTNSLTYLTGDYGGYIWLSLNKMENWTALTTAGARRWRSIIISSNGTFVIVGDEEGYLGKSYNYGTIFQQTTLPPATGSSNHSNYIGMAASNSFLKIALVAVNNITGLGKIYISSDSGDSWSASNAGTNYWTAIVSSNTGTSLAATTLNSGGLWFSSNSGSTWSNISPSNAYSNYNMLAGNYLLNVLLTSPMSNVTSSSGTSSRRLQSSGVVYPPNYVSTDYGVSWATNADLASIGACAAVAVSSNGSIMMCPIANDFIYTSENTGATWEVQEKPDPTFLAQENWQSATIVNECSIIAQAKNGPIWIGKFKLITATSAI